MIIRPVVVNDSLVGYILKIYNTLSSSFIEFSIFSTFNEKKHVFETSRKVRFRTKFNFENERCTHRFDRKHTDRSLILMILARGKIRVNGIQKVSIYKQVIHKYMALIITIQCWSEIIETSAENGVVPVATSNVKLLMVRLKIMSLYIYKDLRLKMSNETIISRMAT